ncbi:MAG: FAD-binding oxidoreductase [Marmoricola sp.]|nr:FAD-binding oxidoreductase [Marmoricola sp.]
MPSVVEGLRAAVTGQVIDNPDAMGAYRRDECLMTPAGDPLVVVRAQSRDDVIATLRVAQATRTPVVTRGAGTGLAGAANALDGCIVLSMAGMNEIASIDPVARTATVQPGVLNGDLYRAARELGLWYVPDPGSRDISTIGGNVATNAGGMCCARYGVTADHVLQLTAVVPGGEVITVGSSTRKNTAGLDLLRLLVGSEGTLGVIVEATVRLLPWPSGRATVAASFPTVRAAVDAVLELNESADPTAVELMDRTTVRAVNAMTKMGLDESAGAVLLIECTGGQAAQDAEECAARARKHGATEVFHTSDPDEGEALMLARRVAFTALERLGTTLLDDVCVPVHRLPELLAAIDRAAEANSVVIGTFGHAADGNLHPTIVFDASEAGALERARAAFDAIVSATLELDGTISGEHGIGSLKSAYLSQQVGEFEHSLMAGIKAVFDPHGVLNPGRGY